MITTIRYIESPKDWIVYDEQDLRDFQVYCSGDQTFSSPQHVYDAIQIPGRNGSLVRDQNKFNNADVTYSCWIGSDFRNNISSLREFLMSKSGYKRLEDTYNPDEYRMGYLPNQLNVKGYYGSTFGQFDLTFTCRPERWLKSGEKEYLLGTVATGNLKNPTKFRSKPLWKVVFTSTTGLIFVANNENNFATSMNFTGLTANRVYYIDSELKQMWYVDNGNVVYANSCISSMRDQQIWLELGPGKNQFSFTNVNIGNSTLKPRWYII